MVLHISMLLIYQVDNIKRMLVLLHQLFMNLTKNLVLTIHIVQQIQKKQQHYITLTTMQVQIVEQKSGWILQLLLQAIFLLMLQQQL